MTLVKTPPRVRRVAALSFVIAALALSGRAEGEGATTLLPLVLPERPFLLISAPRRFLPHELSEVRVQHRGEATLGIAVFRVHEPVALLADGRRRQGVSIAPSALGRESEALLAASGPLPRRGRTLTLVRTREVRVRASDRRARIPRAGESVVYDSYEDDETDVETWGVRAGRWASARVALGRLPTGLYVVRASHAAWAGTTLLSVGSNALLVRRGDRHDEVRVLGPDGAPRAGVRVEAREAVRVLAATATDDEGAPRVEAREAGRLLAAGTTDHEGALRLPASDRGELRFVARQGDDVAWADVAHARIPACDPRVFVGTGRPVFRAGDVMHVRGQVRGCDAAGNERALADETVELEPGPEGPVRVTTDASGNFVAQLVAPRDGILRARVRGRESVRDVTLDARRLPERTLTVTLDRQWAAAGQEVTVQVADEEGGWPAATTVQVRTPAGTQRAPIGPGRPAIVRFRMPPTDEVVARAAVEATLAASGRVQTARAALWTGRRREVIELQTPRVHAGEGERIPLLVRASDLDGAPRPGPIALTVSGSDGNRRVGRARAQREGAAGADGAWRLDLPLVGAGPWWIEARRGESVASLVVRDRPGPPALGRRGDLAVQPARDVVDPGRPLEVDVRMAPGGVAWVTLEQGSVHASRVVRAPSGGGVARVALEVPPEARGMATVVATQVRGSEVRVASATVEVRTSRRFTLSASAERRSYAQGERARVLIEARDAHGAGRAAVASVWLADAGWWDLGDERHPDPTEFFALPGRPASARDGSAPSAYGAEEGRHVEGLLEWNGRRDPRATFRHGWGHGGALVRVDVRGELGEVARAIAAAAGLRGAEVCAAADRALGVVQLRAEQLPWDLVARRAGAHAAEQLRAEEDAFGGLRTPYVEDGRLRFDCESPPHRSSGGLAGSGAGTGSGTGASGHGRLTREERLEGTLFFLGRVPLGPSGRAEIEVPLPDHPGRWRIEALAIGEDGGGARAHATVHTTRPLMASVQVPRWLRVGDESEAALDVTAPGAAGGRVAIALELGPELEPASALPTSVELDARGHGRARFRVRAVQEGAATMIARARTGPDRDDVRTSVRVASSAVTQPIAVRAAVGPRATSVHVPLPPLRRDATLQVRVGGDDEEAIRATLETLREPRWRLAALRLDRMGALLALRRALDAIDGTSETARELDRAVQGEVAELVRMIEADAGSDGTLSFWRGRGRSEAMTAELVFGAWPWRDEDPFRAPLARAVAALAQAVDADAVEPHEAPIVAAALAQAGDAARARRVLSRAAIGEHDLDRLVWAVRATRAMGAPSAPYSARLARAVDVALADGRVPSDACTGPAWFLCYARASERATLARAAEALLSGGDEGGRARAARVAERIAARPAELAWWSWGTSDADAIALFAKLDGAPRTDVHARVLRGGRAIAHLRGGATRVVVPAGTGDLVIALSRAPGRFVRVAVDGGVEVAPAHLGRGPVPLERRIAEEGGERFLEIALELRRSARDVAVTAPLPAGLELTTRAGGGAIGMSTSGRALRWWTAADPSPPPRTPRMRRTEDGVTLTWAELPAGRHRVRIPLTRTAAGRFTAGPAFLRTRDPTRWALTPPLAR